MFPMKLSEVKDIELIAPPMDILDDFTEAALIDKVEVWLREQSDICGILVLSVDMLLYGGLIASRREPPDIAECKRRLSVINDIKNKNPALRIYAFNVIMRTSISVLDNESKVWWEKINQYSILTHKVELENDVQGKRELEKLKSDIPEEILEGFLKTRRRNHEINSACIDLVRQGIFEQLVLLQEDSHNYGIHRKEQILLKKKIEDYNLNDRIQMHNGTDEAGCLLIARSINGYFNRNIAISFEYLADSRQRFFAMYEDRPFHENLMSHAKTCGIILEEDIENSDIVLFIYTPKADQYDACLYEEDLPSGYTAEDLEGFARRIADVVRSGKKVGILDIAYANGGDGRLLYALSRKINLLDLYGYAAWNTASNALGTILAQLSLYALVEPEKNIRFTAERLLDDYLYQSLVRRKLEKTLKEQGLDVWNLKNRKNTANALLTEYIQQCEELTWLFPVKRVVFSCRLAWARTFECEIDVIDIVGYSSGRDSID
jgi:hypothetical protein